MSPMSFVADGGELRRQGELTVTVANTAANEIIAKLDVINSHPQAEVGVYVEKMVPFEERRHPLRTGKIRIEKLI